MTHLVDVNPPGSQEVMVSSGEPAHSLVQDVVSGAEVVETPCLQALAVKSLPLCLWAGDGPICSQIPLLWYSLNPLLCEQDQAAH